jgi:C4-dicarboxylate-specific signal transduction histidine kinase
MAAPQVDLELGESTPLIGSKQPLGELKENSWREKAVAGLAATSVTSSVVSIVISLGNPLVIASAVLGLIAAPYAVFQQQKITQVEALAETNKRVREEVDQLQRENRRLQENVEELESSVKR